MSFIKFKVAVPKNNKARTSDGIKCITNKIVKGKVFKDEDGYKIAINMQNDPVHPDLLVLGFTEQSYELTGKTNVFSRTVDDKGRYIRFIRNPMDAKFMPGLPEQYIPFAPNWVVTGYIVMDNGIRKFDFNSLIGVDGYATYVLQSEDD